MAMAGLGSPADIWRWPVHYYMAVRNEYLKIVGVAEVDEGRTKLPEVAPGITIEETPDR